MNARAPVVCSLLAGLLLAGACQRLHFEKDYGIDPLSDQSLTFDAPRYEQNLTVEVHSPGAPLSVYLVKSAEVNKARVALQNGKAPPGALGGKEPAEDVSFNATVPAGTEFTVFLYNPQRKGASAKVKVTGR